MDRSKLKNKTNKSKDPNDIASYRKQHNLVVSLKNPNSTNVYKSSLSEKYKIRTTLWILIMPGIVFWKVLKLS